MIIKQTDLLRMYNKIKAKDTITFSFNDIMLEVSIVMLEKKCSNICTFPLITRKRNR